MCRLLPSKSHRLPVQQALHVGRDQSRQSRPIRLLTERQRVDRLFLRLPVVNTIRLHVLSPCLLCKR